MREYSAELKELSQPWEMGDRIKTAIDRAARRAGLSYWRAFDIWYGRARLISAAEASQINQALERKRDDAARNELHDLRLRITRLEALLAATARPRGDAGGAEDCEGGRAHRALHLSVDRLLTNGHGEALEQPAPALLRAWTGRRSK